MMKIIDILLHRKNKKNKTRVHAFAGHVDTHHWQNKMEVYRCFSGKPDLELPRKQ